MKLRTSGKAEDPRGKIKTTENCYYLFDYNKTLVITRIEFDVAIRAFQRCIRTRQNNSVAVTYNHVTPPWRNCPPKNNLSSVKRSSLMRLLTPSNNLNIYFVDGKFWNYRRPVSKKTR